MRSGAEVKLLSGSPTTVLVVSGGQARATSHFAHAPGRGLPRYERQNDLLPPDLLHEAAEEVLVA